MFELNIHLSQFGADNCQKVKNFVSGLIMNLKPDLSAYILAEDLYATD